MCDVVCCGKGEMAMYGLVAAGSHAVHAMVRLRCKRFRFFPTSFPVRAPSTVDRHDERLQRHRRTRDENGPTRYGAATRAYRWYFINHDLPSVK